MGEKEPPKAEVDDEKKEGDFNVEGLKLADLKKLLEETDKKILDAEARHELLEKGRSELSQQRYLAVIAFQQSEKNLGLNDKSLEAIKAVEAKKDEATKSEVEVELNQLETNKVESVLQELYWQKDIIQGRISAIESFKEETELEFTYALPAYPGKELSAKLIKTFEGYDIEYQGKRVTVSFGDNILSVDEIKKEYRTPDSTPRELGELAYVLLMLSHEKKRPLQSVIYFDMDGTKGLGRYEIHNDGPGGPLPFDHGGIGIFVEKNQKGQLKEKESLSRS